MASRTRHRPHRGEPGPNVLVTGDTGIYGGPQGGDEPGASESGDLDAREFGVPQADIPGGLVHLANTEAVVAKTPDKALRPADYHKYHGVPSDDGQYTLPPGTELDRPLKAEPEPKTLDAVPVYIVEQGAAHGLTVRRLVSEGPIAVPVTFPQTATGVEPIRLLNRDPRRSKVYLTNETANGKLRVGSLEDVQDGRGLLLPSSAVTTLECQDDLWLANTGAQAGTISWGSETEVEVSGL